MNLHFEETADALVFSLDGKLDDSSASSLPSRLTTFCQGKSQSKIILDLGTCNVESCLGYGALVTFRLSPLVLDKKVTIQNAVPDVVTGMKALRFEKLFSVE
jgi:anti-anti-sigma regulatory factor